MHAVCARNKHAQLFGDDEGHGSVEEAAEGEGKQEDRDNAIQAEKEKWLKQKQQVRAYTCAQARTKGQT